MHIEPLRPEHAPAAATMHHEGQRHTFLGRMGLPFLTALYRELAGSRWGFGLAAVEGDEVVGVATATQNTPALFRDLLLRRGWHLIRPTLAALGQDPSLVRCALETLIYPFRLGHVDRGEFEFLFLGVRRDRRGQGIGGWLVDELIEECRRRGCRTFDSLVEEANEISNALHRDRGFQVKKKITLYGRPMTIYSLPLEEDADA